MILEVLEKWPIVYLTVPRRRDSFKNEMQYVGLQFPVTTCNRIDPVSSKVDYKWPPAGHNLWNTPR